MNSRVLNTSPKKRPRSDIAAIVNCAGNVDSQKHYQLTLRRNLEEDAVAACASERGGAVEVAFLVEDEGGGGISSVAAGEAVQHAVLPGSVGVGCQLEDHAAAVRAGVVPTTGSRAVEITRGLVKHQAGAGRIAVVRIGEPVEDGFLPKAVRIAAQLEHRPAGRRLGTEMAAPAVGRPVKVTRAVEHEPGVDNLPVAWE